MAKHIETDELTAYYQNIYSAIESKTIEDAYGNYVLHRIQGGQKTVFNKTQSEIRNFDMSFLDTIESVYPAILKIMRDPKKSIRYDEEIVSVEKAKKVNSQTVRHLSSHTQLIKEITKEGDVIPSKVLTTYAEEELAIYENRFIKSLVKRIEMFLERRYEVMKVSLESFETQRLNVKNEFLMSGQKVTVDLDISVKNDLTTNVEATKAQYNRLLYVRELVQGLKGTEFMRALAKVREVLPPIMKTNIIMHNPDFKLCYGLWLYLDRVDGLSQDLEVKEKTYKYSNIFDRDINQCMTLALTSFLKNREIDGIYLSKNLPTQKAPKPQQNEDIELELNLGADNKKLEDYTMNQLLLEQTAKFFEASMSGLQRTGNTYNESIRVVYRQMLEMLDQIYPLAFGVADDQLDSKDLYEQLEFARKKIMILKVVRQQKQMNLARMGKEEKRAEKNLAGIEKKIKAQEEKERIRLEKEREKEEQKRLAAIAKAKALEEKQKRLEKEAIEKQKAAERKAAAKTKKTRVAPQSQEQLELAKELASKRREHMKNLRKNASKAAATLPNTEEQSEDTVATDVSKENMIQPEADLNQAVAVSEETPALDDTTIEEPKEEIAENNFIEELVEEVVEDNATDEPKDEILEDSFIEEPVEEIDEEITTEPVEEIVETVDPQIDEQMNDAADAYEQMLKESGMTEEEIDALLNIPSSKS